MPTVREVLDAAAEAHVELTAEGARIKYVTESGPIPEALKAAILAVRPALLQALQMDRAAAGNGNGASRKGRIRAVVGGAASNATATVMDGISAAGASARGRRGGRTREAAQIPAESKADE